MAMIVKNATGFIYYVSREGVTGMQQSVASNIAEMTERIHKYTDLPVAVGFGISSSEQAKLVASQADAVVVGSAVVNQIAAHGADADLTQHVVEFVGRMVKAVKE
jgi:tryptophan synthase alpha chain